VSLAAKIVAAAVVPVALYAATATWSAGTLAGMARESRRAAARAVPATRQLADARESLATVARVHGRWLVLGDASYERLWATRIAELDGRLRRLAAGADVAERRRLAKAVRAVDRHRAIASGTSGLRPLSPDERSHARDAVARARRALDEVGLAIEASAGAAAGRSADLERVAMVAVAGAPAALFVALLAAVPLARRLVAGLRRLAAASTRLERGEPGDALALRGRDELARLGTAFDAMAERVRERDRLTDQVLARIGQELGEPLTTIRDAARALAHGHAGPVNFPQSRIVAILENATEQLVGRVGRMAGRPCELPEPAVDPARIEALPIAFELSPTRLVRRAGAGEDVA
jgi:hypothetical protein